MKRRIGIVILLLLVMVVIGCTEGQPEKSDIGIVEKKIEDSTVGLGQSIDLDQLVKADSSKKSEHLISSQDGGVISIACGNKGRLDIGFLGGAVDKDTVFEVSPTNIARGFYLQEKGSEASVDLKMPASICYVTPDEILEDTMIIKYNDDGKGYTVIPTQRVQMDGVNGLVALVDGFSGYGIGSVSQADLDEMANSMERVGFDWLLRVDDVTDIMMGPYVTYEIAALIEMRNTEAPNSRVMQGTYYGQAVMRYFVDVTVEGETFFGVVEGSDREAEFTLHPVFETYEPEPGSGLPMLCGLVAESYAGKGVLRLRKEISKGSIDGQSGTNIMDIADPLANQWGTPIPSFIDEDMPFTVTTEGPIAYFNFNIDKIGNITLTGSIVGYAKKPEEKFEKPPEKYPEIELEPLVVDKKPKDKEPKPEIEDDYMDDDDMDYDPETDSEEFFPDEESLKDLLPAKEEDLRFHENEDGSVDYDADGDGEPDIRLSPLIVKLK